MRSGENPAKKKKDPTAEGGASDRGKRRAGGETQCRPTPEPNCSQFRLQIALNFFVNGRKKNSLSTREHSLYYKCVRPQPHLQFPLKMMEMHPKPELSSYFFLCTVNIQSTDRGIYIQFGTHGSVQQKRITFKRSAGWQVSTSTV